MSTKTPEIPHHIAREIMARFEEWQRGELPAPPTMPCALCGEAHEPMCTEEEWLDAWRARVSRRWFHWRCIPASRQAEGGGGGEA